MATQTKIAGTGANVASVGGTQNWINTGNITADDATYANASSSVTSSYVESKYLRGTNFGFTIPDGSTINGITVEYQAYANYYSFDPELVASIVQVNMVKSTGRVGTSNSTAYELDTEATYTFGSSSNLWGTTWTAAEINNSGFGVDLVVSFSDADLSGILTAYVDYVKITVDYTPAANTSNMMLMFD